MNNLKQINIKNLYYSITIKNNTYYYNQPPEHMFCSDGECDTKVVDLGAVYINNKFVYQTKEIELPHLWLTQKYKAYQKYLILVDKIKEYNKLLELSKLRELDQFEVYSLIAFVSSFNQLLKDYGCTIIKD